MTRTSSGFGSDHITDKTTFIVISSFLSIAIYNVIELGVIIPSVFKKRGGFYFWSFVMATVGILLQAIGFILKYVDSWSNHNTVLVVVIISIGWVGMVTGQSLVLYSRLHLVLLQPMQLRFVLAMIIFDAIVLHIPVIILTWGANVLHSDIYLGSYKIMERIQVTVFFIQELIISTLYIFATARLLSDSNSIRGRKAHRVMSHLVYVNIIVIFLGITILGLEYSGLHSIQTGYKTFVYSVKLKAEFSILNQLVGLTRTRNDGGRVFTLNEVDIEVSNDRTRTTLDGNDMGRLSAARTGDLSKSGGSSIGEQP